MKSWLIICGVALFAFSCTKCDIKKPKGVKPIDWENYNDVYSVFWNCTKDCSEVNETEKNFDSDDLKTIKVYGWIYQGFEGGYPPVNPEHFCIIDKEENIFAFNSSVGTSFYVRISYLGDFKILIESLKIKFAAADITKKCYINGKLSYENYPGNGCCTAVPLLIIHSSDDIYFEEE